MSKYKLSVDGVRYFRQYIIFFPRGFPTEKCVPHKPTSVSRNITVSFRPQIKSKMKTAGNFIILQGCVRQHNNKKKVFTIGPSSEPAVFKNFHYFSYTPRNRLIAKFDGNAIGFPQFMQTANYSTVGNTRTILRPLTYVCEYFHIDDSHSGDFHAHVVRVIHVHR